MKIKVTVSTDMIGSSVSKIIEIDDEEFDQMPENDKFYYIDDYCYSEAETMYSWDWEEVKE